MCSENCVRSIHFNITNIYINVEKHNILLPVSNKQQLIISLLFYIKFDGGKKISFSNLINEENDHDDMVNLDIEHGCIAFEYEMY